MSSEKYLMKLPGTISIDIDTFLSIFKETGLFKEDYDWSDFREGLENIQKFFNRLEVKTTLFCVGQDFCYQPNKHIIQDIHREGHEIANHTMTHAQGLRLLTRQEKEKEISDFEVICKQVIGERPLGFRAPGWNIDKEIFQILADRKYKYDSSIFPTYLMPLMKIFYFIKMRKAKIHNRTTMGELSYMFYPILPHQIKTKQPNKVLHQIKEFPITVTPILRLPVSATFLFEIGEARFNRWLCAIKDRSIPIQFMFHLFDFIDFNKEIFSEKISKLKKVYIPQSLKLSYAKKISLVNNAFDFMLKYYQFMPYRERCI